MKNIRLDKASSSKLLILGSLYISQYLPMTFFYQTLPIFMRQQGASLETIGALGFLALPWMLKFLWSPIIDRFSLNRDRHYGTWILFFQILLASCVAISGMLDVRQNFPLLMGFTLLACLCSASQDIATDALAVRILVGAEKAWGSTIQSAGNYLGSIIGGGGILILLDRVGWRCSLLAIAVIILLSGIPLLRHKEYQIKNSATTANWASLISFFQREKMIPWVLLLLLYLAGTSMAGAMMRPLLIDLKFSLTEIGQIIGLVSCSAGIIGAVVGGAIVSKWGAYRSLIWFGIFQGISILACIPLARGVADLPIVYATNISLQVFAGMCDMAIATVMLEKSRLTTAGTDYTIQTSLIYFSAILAMFFSGAFAEHLGYQGMLFIAFGICLVSVILIQRWEIVVKNPPLLQLMPASIVESPSLDRSNDCVEESRQKTEG
jgi:MFS family permease